MMCGVIAVELCLQPHAASLVHNLTCFVKSTRMPSKRGLILRKSQHGLFLLILVQISVQIWRINACLVAYKKKKEE
jgi:hypothetical protein